MNIYGWCSNMFGNLGLVGNSVPDPKLIPIPEMEDKKDFIVSISCGKRNSAFLTEQGQVWITGNYQPEKLAKPKVVEDNKSEALLEAY